jgi:hypothetical protein
VPKAFRILNYVIAAEVLIQAALIAWAVFGLSKYVDHGGVINKNNWEEGSDVPFTGAYGFTLHAINGMALIPLLGLALLVVAFVAKIPGGLRFAGILFVLILVQAYLLPILSSGIPLVGMLHGAVALAILGMTITGGKMGAAAMAAAPAPGTPA